MDQKQIEKNIREIQRHLTIGKKILDKCGDYSPPGLIIDLAEKFGLNRDKAQKVRVMAAPATGYTPAELNSLFAQFRKAQWALTISHLVKLVSVPKGSNRNRLTREAIKQKWSSHRLQAEILAEQGRRKQGGRQPTVIAGSAFDAHLKQTMWAWDRWLAMHLQANPQVRPEIAKELKSIRLKIAKVSERL